MHPLFFDTWSEALLSYSLPSSCSPKNVSQNCDNNLSVYVINARSIVNKIDLLRAYVHEYRPHVVCITESWAHDGISDAYLSVKNYSHFRCDRKSCLGGGVLLYVSSDLCAVQISSYDDNQASVVTCRVSSTSNDNLLISCVYIPPDYCLLASSLLNHLSNIVNCNNCSQILCGDFNCPNINWTLLSAPPACQPLLDWCLDLFLTQNVIKPTRPLSKSVLDLVFSTVDTHIDNVSVNECFGTSDHAIVSFVIPSFSAPHVVTTESNVFVFDKANWKLFRNKLFDSKWPLILPTSDINSVWSQYLKNIISSAEFSIPMRRKRPWSPRNSERVRMALRNHRRIFNHYASSPTNFNQWKLNYSQSLVNSEIKKAIQHHEYKICSFVSKNTSSKPFWSYVKSKLNTSTQFSVIVNDDGVTLSDHRDIANCFNAYFSSTFNSRSHYPTLSDAINTDVLNFVHFSPIETLKTINALPDSTSLDGSGLCYKFIKNGGYFLASKLTDFFSFSLLKQEIPNDWRNIIVTPTHKSGPKSFCKNFRPIALTNCVSRIMERIVSRTMMNFLISHNPSLHSSQHGFYPGRSVETASVSFADFLTQNLDRGKIVDTVFLDFAKAFDSVPHSVLIEKLRFYGISGALLFWLADYLQGRQQSVRVHDVISNPAPVTSGVIQGSVLGPLLFTIFIDDIDLCVKNSHIIKYADDVKLFVTSSRSGTSNSALQDDLNAICRWSISNGISLNVAKCKTMCFGDNNCCYQYFLSNVSLDTVSTFKDLGITLSSSNVFKEHIYTAVAKANRMLGLIKKSFCTRDPKCLLILYKAYVRSILEFSCVIWSPYVKYLIDCVEKVQKRFCNFFPCLHGLSYQSKLVNLNLLSLESRRLRYKLIFFV